MHSKIFYILILMVNMLAFMQAKAQNIAPLATVSGSNCSTGPCSSFNDLNYLSCGTQQVWVSTSSPPSLTPGVDWIQWDWPSTQTFSNIIIHHANASARFLTGGLIQLWNGSAWVNHYTFSNLPMQCINDVPIPIATTARMRITAFQMTGTGQLSNPNFREIEIIGSANCTGMPTAGTVSFSGSDTIVCGTSKNLQLTNPTGGLGISYYWQRSIDNGATWTAFDSNATTATASNVVVPTLIRTTIYCSYSNMSSNSNVVKLNTSKIPFSLGNDTVICDNASINLSTITYAPNTVLWDDNTNGMDRLVTQPGTYYASIVLSNTCSASDTITIEDGVEPVNPFTTSYDLCEDGTIILDAENTGMSYLWNTNSTNATINVTQAGNYNVNITSPDNCAKTFSTNVISRPKPIINIPSDITICSTDSFWVDATATYGDQYNWSNNVNTPGQYLKLEGEYIVYVTSSFDCEQSDTITLHYKPDPLVNGFTFIPGFENDILKVKFAPINGTNVTFYYWEFGDGNTSYNPTPIHKYDSFGNYNIKLTVYNDCSENYYEQAIEIKDERVTSVTDIDGRKVSIYPNPTQDIINITSTVDIQSISIFSVDGKKQPNIQYSNNQVNVAHLPAGYYSCIIQFVDDKQAVLKLVIQ